MTAAKHTPGPWRWEFNTAHRSVHLVGGRPRFDLTVMDFTRWGMGGAVPRFRDPAHDGMQLMHRLCDRADWLATQPGREHHADWHLLVTHPDARLMEAAPDLLEALSHLFDCLPVGNKGARMFPTSAPHAADLNAALDRARAAIAKATGES